MLFDSHCHLTADAFAGDADGVLARARAAGVGRVVTVASHADDAVDCLAIADRHADVWCTAGIHPHDAGQATPEQLARIRALLDAPRVVAVGECGLDFHYDHAPREVQRSVFRAQVELAAESGLPLVVHSRDADAEMITELEGAAGEVRGVLHCFTGGDALLEQALEVGWYVSFSGIVTFKKFENGAHVRRIPPDRLMIETDAPYLAPVPWRGRRNEPAFVGATAEAVARLREVPLDELVRTTFANASRFYGLDRDEAAP